MNTGEHSTWNFWNGSAKIRMGKGMCKDKVEGKKGVFRNFVDSGHHSRNYFNDKQDNVQTGCKKSTKIATADSDGTCRKQGFSKRIKYAASSMWENARGFVEMVKQTNVIYKADKGNREMEDVVSSSGALECMTRRNNTRHFRVEKTSVLR